MEIPKIIIQTVCIKNIDDKTKNKIIKNNPDYKYKYFNNDNCIKFITDNFSKSVVNAFHKLKPGAFKADLFRYCYLFINI